MSIAVSTTDHDATAARLGRELVTPPDGLTADEEVAAALAIARACQEIHRAGDVGAFATPAGRGAYLRDAVRGALAAASGRGERAGRMNAPEFVP